MITYDSIGAFQGMCDHIVNACVAQFVEDTNSAEECCWAPFHLVENHRIKTCDSGGGSLAYHLLLVSPGQNCSVSHLCLALSSVIWWVYLYLPQRGILKRKWHNPHKVGNRMPYYLENTHWLVATLIFLTLKFCLHISKFRLQLPKNISFRSVYNMLSSCIRWLHKKKVRGLFIMNSCSVTGVSFHWTILTPLFDPS